MPNKTIYEGGDDFQAANPDAPPKSKQDKMNDKYGDQVKDYKVNPAMADGCVKKRGCTDIICLGIFIAFLVGMFSLTSYCFAEGDVAKYLAPVDHNNKICGYGDMKGKDFLTFDILSSDIFSTGECAEKCPQCYHSTFKYCMPTTSKTTKVKECIDLQNNISAFEKAFGMMLESNKAGKQVMDLYKSSRAIYTSIATAILLCFAYIYLMSYFAEQIAWTIIGITQISLFVGTGACIFEYLEKHSSTDKLVQEAANGFLIGGIVLGLATIIMLIMLICGFNQLKIAIDVVDASADFIKKTKRVIIVPVIYFILQVTAVMVTMFAFVCVWSIGDIEAKDSTLTNPYHQLKTVTFKKGTADDMYYIAMAMFFGLLWIIAFFNAQQSFIVMVAGCSYYFDSSKTKDGDADVGMGIKFAWVNHVGSLAMGSFLVALVEFLRVVVAVIVEQATKASGNNPVVKCIGCVANCCMECLQKVIDYINKAAYAYMAVSGEGFCKSAWDGFMLNMKHGLEFAWARVLAELFILTGKLSLVALNCGVLYLTMNFVFKDFTGTDAVSSIYSPMIVVAVITYVAASVFLGLFSNTVLALMTCLAIDVDLNGEPKFGPPTFHDSLDKFKTEKTDAIEDGGWAAKSDPEAPKGNQVE